MKKSSIYLVGLLILFLHSNIFSWEIQPFMQVYAPAEISILKEEKGIQSERETKTDLIYEGGLEFLFSAEFAPMQYGFGLGYKTAQKKNSTDFVPASIPLWGVLTIGSTNREQLLRPYLALRLGYIAPFTTSSSWWEWPVNYIINAGLGCEFPYDINLEIMYDYTSMQKSFEYKDLNYRVNSPRVAARISVSFEMSHDRIYDPNKAPKKKVIQYQQSDEAYSSENDEDFAAFTEEEAQPIDTTSVYYSPEATTTEPQEIQQDTQEIKQETSDISKKKSKSSKKKTTKKSRKSKKSNQSTKKSKGKRR